jgi:hypothetical protein
MAGVCKCNAGFKGKFCEEFFCDAKCVQLFDIEFANKSISKSFISNIADIIAMRRMEVVRALVPTLALATGMIDLLFTFAFFVLFSVCE